jgi:predicted nuclease of predicted toxin-antitoxin system
MNLLADEGVERQIVEQLRKHGHAVLYIAEMEPGVGDEIILGRANAQHALLITADKDFGELVFRQHAVHAGVLLLRLAGLPPAIKAQIVGDVLRSRATELPNAFSVISPGSVRIRKQTP